MSEHKHPKHKPTSNNDPIGGSELSTLLYTPDPEVKRIASAILHGLSPDVRAPVAIAGLTLALAETIIANTSPPQKWAAVTAERLQAMVSAYLPPGAPTKTN
jgi:hypothetical protein